MTKQSSRVQRARFFSTIHKHWVFAFVIFCAMFPIQSQALVVNGVKTDAYEAVRKMTIEVSYTDPKTGTQVFNDGGYCTANQISSHWYLTAAHCVLETTPGEKLESLSLLAHPSESRQSGIKKTKVDRIINSGEYIELMQKINQLTTELQTDLTLLLNPNAAFTYHQYIRYYKGKRFYYDIALIHTEEALPEPKEGYLPLRLRPIEVGTDVTLIGYGKTDMVLNKYSDSKRMGTNRLINCEDGVKLLCMQGRVSNPILKNTGQMASVGSGDSGGPILVDGAIAGIAVGANSDQMRLYENLRENSSIGFLKRTKIKIASWIDRQLIHPDTQQTSIGNPLFGEYSTEFLKYALREENIPAKIIE